MYSRLSHRSDSISGASPRRGSALVENVQPKVGTVASIPVIPPTPGATYITVRYGDTKTLVNPECSLINMFLHIKAKYTAHKDDLPKYVVAVDSLSPQERPPGSAWKRVLSPHREETIWCLDLIDQEGNPLELCNRDSMHFVRPFIVPRAEYILCMVNKTKDGLIKDAEPLVTKTSIEFRRRLDTIIKSMERAKKSRDRQQSTRHQSDGRKKIGGAAGRNSQTKRKLDN